MRVHLCVYAWCVSGPVCVAARVYMYGCEHEVIIKNGTKKVIFFYFNAQIVCYAVKTLKINFKKIN